MKTSKFVTVAMFVALAALVGCGKSDSKKSSGYTCGVNLNCSNTAVGTINDQTQIASQLVALQNHFTSKGLVTGINGSLESLFYVGGVTTKSNSFLGLFNYNSSSWKQSCEFTKVVVNGSGLNFARATNNCGSVPTSQLANLTSYDPASNDDLEDALNGSSNTQAIYQRVAVWSLNGVSYQQTQAYTIITARNFGTELVEYTIVPDLPTHLNPVAIRNYSTGAVKQFQGLMQLQ